MALEGNVPAARLLCSYAWGVAATVPEVEAQEADFQPLPDVRQLWRDAFGTVPDELTPRERFNRSFDQYFGTPSDPPVTP